MPQGRYILGVLVVDVCQVATNLVNVTLTHVSPSRLMQVAKLIRYQCY